MKKCSYCGGENVDAAARCVECGTDQFTDADQGRLKSRRRETLVRDYPKPIVVVGLWIMFLPGFVGGSAGVLGSLFGAREAFLGVPSFVFSAAATLICGYALHRSVKNYKIHRARLLRERANDLRSNQGESLDTTT